MSKIKAVIFDAGDVIFDATVWRKWLHKKLRNENLTKLTYDEMYLIWENNFLYEVYRGRKEYGKAFKEFLKFLQLNSKQIEMINKESNSIKPTIEKAMKPNKWVYQLFPKLKERGVKIGILTDSEQGMEIQTKRYEKWNLLEYIDIVSTSADTGFVKPDPKAYLNILKQLQVKSSEDAIFVGHDDEELIGAKNAELMVLDYRDKIKFRKFIENF